jgi:hypothetical protein
MELALGMPLSEARRVLDGQLAIERLLMVDALWTATLTREVAPEDASSLVGIGEEMVGLLHHLRGEAGFFRGLVERDADGFERAVEEVLAASDMQAGYPISQPLREEFGPRGWALETIDAISYLGESEAVEEELLSKLALIREGRTTPGDLPHWWKCGAHLASFGLEVVLVVAFPPAAAVEIAIHATTGAIHLAFLVPECRGAFRRPPQADNN